MCFEAQAPFHDDETALLAQWRMGDPEAGLRLLQRQVGPLREYFRRRVPCRADVEDLVQRTLLAAVEALPRYREDVAFSAFVRAIASKLRLRHHRDVERARERMEADARPDAMEADDPSMSACMLREDTCDRLRRAVSRLPHDSARLLRLRYWEERDTGEIARELGLKRGTVRVRLLRARNEVKRELAQATASDSDVWPIGV